MTFFASLVSHPFTDYRVLSPIIIFQQLTFTFKIQVVSGLFSVETVLNKHSAVSRPGLCP